MVFQRALEANCQALAGFNRKEAVHGLVGSMLRHRWKKSLGMEYKLSIEEALR